MDHGSRKAADGDSPGQEMVESQEKIHYEIQIFHGGDWVIAGAAPQPEELIRSAEIIRDSDQVAGLRVVKCRVYDAYGHADSIVIRQWMRDKLPNAGIGGQVVERGANILCRKPEDFHGTDARRVMADVLSHYFEVRKLTPLELLHNAAAATALVEGAWSAVWQAMQKVALAQASAHGLILRDRVQELAGIVQAAATRLKQEAREDAPPEFTPETFAAAMAELAHRTPAKAQDRQAYRALAAHLEGAETWLEKLGRLALLAATRPPVAELVRIDTMMAEMVAMPGLLYEASGCDPHRAPRILTAARYLIGAGKAPARAEALAPGIEALGRLIKTGALPRTRSTLRGRLLAEIESVQPLRPEEDLKGEFAAIGALAQELAAIGPEIAQDVEVTEALDRRGARALYTERVHNTLGLLRLPSDKIARLIELMADAPGPRTRRRLEDYVLSLFSPQDILFHLERGETDSVAALPEIIRLMAGIGGAPLDDDSRDLMVSELDDLMREVLRRELVENRLRPMPDRIQALFGFCLKNEMPEGRARTYAARALCAALRSPEFRRAINQRMKTEDSARAAFARLQQIADKMRAGAGPLAEALPGDPPGEAAAG